MLEHWLEPALFGHETHLELSGAAKIGLAAVAVAVGLVGIAVAATVYLRGRGDRAAIEQPILADAWRVDRSYAWFMGGPGRRSFDLTARFDRTVVDGAVNGVATLVRTASSGLRVAQTGFVRTYALGIALGTVALLVLFLSRAAF